jgi:hypothetical protein
LLASRLNRQPTGATTSSEPSTASLVDGFGPRDANGVADGAEAAVARAASSPGEPLPDVVRGRFERSLHTDLSGVRVHAGSESAEAAKAVGAKAYTVGQDIHFGAGHYAPADPAGIHLLAHEVAHTLQDRGGAPPRFTKLEVSTPADPAEVEADRAADAIVTGTSSEIGGAAGAVYRDPDPQTDPTPTPPVTVAPGTPGTDTPGTPQAVPPGTPGAPPPPAASTTDGQVNVGWEVDWVRKQTGSVVSSTSNARTGRDAAYGTMKINPEGADPKSFRWVNAAPSGAVDVGSMPHPKDKGGKVSSDIAYGKPPSASASVTVTASADAAEKAQAPEKRKAAADAVSDKLADDLQDMGDFAAIQADLQKTAESAVADADNPYSSYDVKVTLKRLLDPGDGHPKSAPAVPYDPIPADGKRIVTITVPTEIQKLKGTQAVETQTVDSTKVVEKKGQETTTTTDVRTDVTTQLSQGFKNAYTKMQQSATHDATSLSGNFKGNLGGTVSAGGSFKDLDIDLGTILGLLAVEDPPLALALKSAFGHMTASGDLDMTLGGSLSSKIDASKQWSDDEVKNELTKMQSQFESKIDTKASSVIQTKVKQTYSLETTKEQGTTKKAASSTETIGVKFIIGDQPVITVQPD